MGFAEMDDSFALSDDMVDVSHGIGIPFGGIGTGYSVYGKFGFVNVNFNSRPDYEQSMQFPGGELWKYTEKPDRIPPFAFLLQEGTRELLLQEAPLLWMTTAECAETVKAYAYLPKGYFSIEKPGWEIKISMEAFSPMIPYDLANSTVPVQIFDLSIINGSEKSRRLKIWLKSRQAMAISDNIPVLSDPDGSIAFACKDGFAESLGVGAEFSLQSGERRTVRFVIAWFYPLFNTPSPFALETYRRYYTKSFESAADIAAHAQEHAGGWSAAIDKWHGSYDVPACFKRLWFSSLSSVITSTMMSNDPCFFEIESPHTWINTMDVTIYSSWIYMVNWPELEKMDMSQYVGAMPASGPDAGFVWHSLWSEGADYMEEPIFPARMYRDYLWLHDRQWLESVFDSCVLSAGRAYGKGHYEYLLSSDHGNQSYDCWKMPGVSAYVNSAWLFSLYALKRMSEILGKPVVLAGLPIGAFMAGAFECFNKILWNEAERYWNCFFRTPAAQPLSVAEASFLDQLFGLWLLLIDREAANLLPREKITSALESLYSNNLVEDKGKMFRGWANGMLPGRMPDMESGYHSRTCWMGAQLNMGSLLGAFGEERKAVDVFVSLEQSLCNNHLAVGEWNRSVDSGMKSRTLPEEPCKDTPRFPPYPRYKCSWEYLVRMLGMTMDERHIRLNPFKSFGFRLTDVELAGKRLTVFVEKEWNKVRIDGMEYDLPIELDRENHEGCIVEFIHSEVLGE